MATLRRGRGRLRDIGGNTDDGVGAKDTVSITGASRGGRATRSATARASAGSQKQDKVHSSRGSDAASTPGSWASRSQYDSKTNFGVVKAGSERSSAHDPEISVDLEGIRGESPRLPRRSDPGSAGRPDAPAQARHGPGGEAMDPDEQVHVASPQIACAWAPPGKHEDSLAAKLSLGCGATRPNRPSLAAAGAVNIKQRKMMLMNALSGSSVGGVINTRRSSSMAAACGEAPTAALAPEVDGDTASNARLRAALLEAELAGGDTDTAQIPELLDESLDASLSIGAGKAAMTPGITGRINQRMRELQDVVQKLGCEGSMSPYVLTSGAYGDRSSSSPAWSAPDEAVAATADNREQQGQREGRGQADQNHDDDHADDDDGDDEVAFTKLDKRFSNITSRRSTRASTRITFELKQPSPPPDSNLEFATGLHHPTFGRRVLSAFGRSVYGTVEISSSLSLFSVSSVCARTHTRTHARSVPDILKAHICRTERDRDKE